MCFIIGMFTRCSLHCFMASTFFGSVEPETIGGSASVFSSPALCLAMFSELKRVIVEQQQKSTEMKTTRIKKKTFVYRSFIIFTHSHLNEAIISIHSLPIKHVHLHKRHYCYYYFTLMATLAAMAIVAVTIAIWRQRRERSAHWGTIDWSIHLTNRKWAASVHRHSLSICNILGYVCFERRLLIVLLVGGLPRRYRYSPPWAGVFFRLYRQRNCHIWY